MKTKVFKITILLVVMGTIIGSVFSQDAQPQQKSKLKKNEFNFSFGLFSTIESIPPLDIFADGIHLFSYQNEKEELSKIGSFNIEYCRRFTKVYSLGLSLSYSFSRNREVWYAYHDYDYSNPIFFNIDTHIFSIFLNNKFSYINNSKFNLYSLFGIGFTYGKRAYNTYFVPKNVGYFDFQLGLIGFSFKGKIPFFMEIGIGPQGIFKMGFTI
ncbi:MAG: hypothetical protein H6Q25_27 [Bacteroidetes bacterium]|nr:hypothetical protein [Bacteroidota bacterium]